MQVYTSRMLTLSELGSFPAALRGGVLCIGNFDGVHVGHALMLSTGRKLAAERGIPFTIMTFDPHPSTILFPQSPRPALTTLSQRMAFLAAFSPDAIIVMPTTRELLAMPAEDFLGGVVRQTLAATEIVEGPTFTFGRGAKGDVAMLQARGAEYGFRSTIVDTVEITLSDLLRSKVSSSVIRWLVENGRVLDAAAALGRPYTLRGTIVEGKKRGRTIGFPTANLETPQLLPAPGVYAGRATVGGVSHRAAISVGTNPTFNGKGTTVEAFLLDFSGDLYGETMDLEFTRYLREMLPFGGSGPLVRQMERDVALTRAVTTI
jgi:riboflavin kinase/FMN adenylyltransferase